MPCLHADDGVVRAGHPGVRDRGRSPRLHARVVCLDVRVRPDHRSRLAVEQARERNLLARRFRMDVDDDHGRPSARFVDDVFRDLERMDLRVQEERALQIHDGDLRTGI